MVKKRRGLLILLLYFIFISILFFLPGSAFPKNNWLAKIGFDKWVHIGLFTCLTYLFCWAIEALNKKFFLFIFLSAVIYGISVEFLQDMFVVNRSFDLGDWAADIVGSFVGVWIWNLRYKKK